MLKPMWKVTLAVLLLPLMLAARTWELRDGTKLEAELASYQNGMVILLKDKGGKAMLSIAKFSSADQALIREAYPEGDKTSTPRTSMPVKPKPAVSTPAQERKPTSPGHPGLSKLNVGSVPPQVTWRIPSTMELSETDLAKYHGKLLLVQFWATWVPESLTEMQKIAQLYPRLSAGGMEVIGVNMDTSWATFDRQNKKLEKPWHSFYDPERVTAEDWGLVALPTNVLIDQNGTIVAEHIPAELLIQALAYYTQPRR